MWGSQSRTALQTVYWRDKRFVYDASGYLTYFGFSATGVSASPSDDIWFVWKCTYTGASNDLTRLQGPLEGAWDDRATLSW